MMTEEEYNKMVQERENYKRFRMERHQYINDFMHDAHVERTKNIIRMVNPDKSDEELFRDDLITPVTQCNFYYDEGKRLRNFLGRLKKKLFG